MKSFNHRIAFKIRRLSYKSDSSFDNVAEELITPINKSTHQFNPKMFKFQATPTWYPSIYRKNNSTASKKSNDVNELYEMQYSKLWNLPVDNEEGKEEKFKETFDEHVFLRFDPNDLPKDSSFETFLSTVVVGLQRNPYMTIEQKEKIIKFFIDYFNKFKN